MSYDCDTGAGRFSELKQVQPGPAYRISGRIAANELGKHERWLPVGNINITSADNQTRAMLQITASERKAPLDVLLRVINGDNDTSQTLGKVALSQELAFVLSVADGKVKVEIGDMRGEAQISMSGGASVAVGCSTGNFHFEDLRFGAGD